MNIERDGQTLATINMALIAPVRERFAIELEDASELSAKGNITDHEYQLKRDDRTSPRSQTLVPPP